MELSDPNRPVDWAEIVTCDAADELSAYELARHWGDPMAWPLAASARDELAELACMSALARWLARWQPINVHRALLKGAPAEDVAAAFGGSVEETGKAWYQWADYLRRWSPGGKLGIKAEEYEKVAAIFTAAGVTAPDAEVGR